MLSRKIPKLRLGQSSKGRSSNSPTILKKDSFSLKNSKLGKYMLNEIPVLSIFALISILGVNLILPAHHNATRAATYTASSDSGNSTISFAIAGSGESEQVPAGRGNTVYRAHTVTLNATNIESYVLTISGNPNMTNPNGVNTTDTVTSTNDGIQGINLADNTWGYSYGGDIAQDAMLYHPLSNTGTIIDSGSPTDHSITNQTKNLIFAAKFGEEIPQGRYYANVELKITATPHAITYTLSYDANNGNGTPPTTQTATSESSSHEFTVAGSGNLTRENFIFLGWAETPDATLATYTANDKIALSSTAPTKTLYAIWQEFINFPSTLTTMQGMTKAICNNTSIGATKSLQDTRGGSYNIKKLNDGNCWMTDNLSLSGVTLNSTTSDVSSFSLPSSNSTTFTSSNQYTASVYIAGTYQGYYSWAAATAGAGKTSSTTTSSTSICPKGWKLPSVTDYTRLINLKDYQAGNDGVYMGGAFWPYGGAFYDGKANSKNNGYYSTSNANSTTKATVMKVYSGAPMIDGDIQRYTGTSVRCVAYSS